MYESAVKICLVMTYKRGIVKQAFFSASRLYLLYSYRLSRNNSVTMNKCSLWQKKSINLSRCFPSRSSQLALMYLKSLISSTDWSKQSLLFSMIFMHTIYSVWMSQHWIALLKAAEPRYSTTWQRPAIIELTTIGKSFVSSKPVFSLSNTTRKL